MSRARRLAEIAKANEPAFSGPQWWLADPSSKPEEPAADQAAPPSLPKSTSSSSSRAEQPEIAVAASNGHHPASRSAESGAGAVATAAAPEISVHESPAYQPLVAAVPAPQPAESTPAIEEPEQGSNFASRLSSLKEKFLWLGRKKSSEE